MALLKYKLNTHPNMPKGIANIKNIKSVLSSLFLILIVPGILYSETKFRKLSVYALTVESTIINGKNTESRFNMTPANDEYRIDGFKTALSKGSSSESSQNPFDDSVNDALSKLTVNKGLKSLRSSQSIIDGNLTDVTTMRHEGVIKYPYKTRILKNGPNNEINVEVEVEFSAFSMPSEWGWQRFKKSVSNNLSDVVSVFRQIWD